VVDYRKFVYLFGYDALLKCPWRKSTVTMTVVRFAASALFAIAAFAVPAGGASARTFKSLYTFKGGADGINPVGPLVMDAKGNLYGVTTYGGSENAGIVFELSPPASGQMKWAETIIAQTGYPLAGLIIDKNGALCGVNWAEDGPGLTVFKLTPPSSDSGSWTETIIDKFDQHTHEGHGPDQPLTMDGKGRIYGTTSSGGLHNIGTVFMLDPSKVLSDGEWQETLLYEFPTGTAQSNVTVDASGNVYGLSGSALFKLTPPAAGNIYYRYKALASVCNGQGAQGLRRTAPASSSCAGAAFIP
jgi:uncharacterized repeat protein (TIGR03803 family)